MLSHHEATTGYDRSTLTSLASEYRANYILQLLMSPLILTSHTHFARLKKVRGIMICGYDKLEASKCKYTHQHSPSNATPSTSASDTDEAMFLRFCAGHVHYSPLCFSSVLFTDAYEYTSTHTCSDMYFYGAKKHIVSSGRNKGWVRKVGWSWFEVSASNSASHIKYKI